MIDFLIRLAIVAAVAGAMWWVCQPRLVFKVCIARGVPRLVQGQVTAACWQHLVDACRREGVETGWIGGVLRGKRTELRFSRHIPPECRQQLRNGWEVTG